MDIKLAGKRLYWEIREATMDEYDGEDIDFSHLNSGVEELIDGAESCEKLITNRKHLSDKEFCEMLLKFTRITNWNDYDCYKILELVHNMKFVDDAVIKTTMHAICQKTEGHGRDFSWWNEEVGINFRIVYTKDFEVDYDHTYSIEEIKGLIDKKKILIISEEERNLAWDEKNYEKEEYQRFDCAYEDYDWKYKFFDESGEYYPYTLKYIGSRINKKKLLKLFKSHLEHINSEIYNVTSWNEEYSNEFESLGYSKRLALLNYIKN